MINVDTTLTDVHVAKKLGLTEEEYHLIEEHLGRIPNFVELSIYSVMWSEHCSYKNSIKYLKTLPKEGSHMLVAAGEENAGLVDIGDGLACAFKIESHNHPSAIEPYQGAATGVGGIHRDIFTMGARPIAAMNSLRFGELDTPRTKHLLAGVVKGIGDYGNCLGVPTVGGETYFRSCYEQNILVNAMSIGIVKHGDTVSATAEGVGNPVFIVGSATGKDGIHGATFASADLTEDSAQDLPSVQVGDPFQEKLLLEATLEVIQTGVVVGMQDMGAAGISCSSSEMSAKAGTGMRIDLDKVPTRQPDMKAFEILLSESQERMLVVCSKGEEEKLLEVYQKWDLECAQIGVVTDTGRLEFYQENMLVADVPAKSLVLGEGAPVYDRSYKEAKYYAELQHYDSNNILNTPDLIAAALRLVESPNIASKNWISEQYDHTVRINNANTNRPSDASIVRVKETNKALVCSVDCNSRHVYADPKIGTMIAVCEAARNIVCSGGKPSAITNCLNFGNPYNPEVYWQFVQAIEGMSTACRALGTPVTGGNVSFYNQTVLEGKQAEPVFPTPTIGMLGIMEDLHKALYLNFVQEGDCILLLGEVYDDLNSSEYIMWNHGIMDSKICHFNMAEELALQRAITQLHERGLLLSAHDVSDGGMFITMLESAMAAGLGFKIQNPTHLRDDVFLFGEGQSRAVVTCSSEDVDAVRDSCAKNNIPTYTLGTVSADSHLWIGDQNFGEVAHWKNKFNNILKEKLD